MLLPAFLHLFQNNHMKQLPFYISVVALIVIGYLYLQQKKQLYAAQQENKMSQINSQNDKKYIDSLKNELFIAQTNQTRYEIAIEYLKEEDENAWEKSEEIIRTKTE